MNWKLASKAGSADSDVNVCWPRYAKINGEWRSYGSARYDHEVNNERLC